MTMINFGTFTNSTLPNKGVLNNNTYSPIFINLDSDNGYIVDIHYRFTGTESNADVVSLELVNNLRGFLESYNPDGTNPRLLSLSTSNIKEGETSVLIEDSLTGIKVPKNTGIVAYINGTQARGNRFIFNIIAQKL